MLTTQALADFQSAREHYIARRFEKARRLVQRYRDHIDYTEFTRLDNRSGDQPVISVIIVTYATGSELLACIQSVLTQQGPSFEILVVDNGQNEAIHDKLEKLPICWIRAPINMLPSEGRNMGAHFACSDILVFLDDDALMDKGYLVAVQQRALESEYLALRGRILPKSNAPALQSPHYDLGDTEKPAKLNLEGNMVIRRRLFQALGGFDPLMFGHEGNQLTNKWRGRFPGKDILYCPELKIRHEWAQVDDLANKRNRQALGMEYLNYMDHMNKGISILLRAGDQLAEAETFLEGLATHNSHRPIEVLIWAKDSQQAVAITRPFIANFFTLVLPSSIQNFSRMAQACRYDNYMIIDLPTQIQADVLSGWLQRQQADLKSALVCTKAELEKLGETQISIALEQLAIKLGKTLADKPAASISTLTKVQPAKLANWQQKEAPKIQQTEAQIQQLETQLSQTDQTITELEARYLPLPDDSMEKHDLKDDLEEQVLASCRLLIELKDAQDNLQELRIRRLCGPQ